MAKIAFFKLEPWAEEYIRSQEVFKDHELLFFDQILSIDTMPEDTNFEVASIFVNSVVTQDVLDKLSHLKYLVTRSTGYDHIDTEACKKKWVSVSNVPSYGENTVAEFAFALILSLSRKIPQSRHRIREEGNWGLEGLQGFDLKDKTLGVIGTGRIGTNTIKIAKGFGMNVIAHDAFPNGDLAKELSFEYQTLEDVLKKSDIVTLHVPYIKKTHHLINKDNIGLMKKGSYLINTSRGAVVETEALVKALHNGNLGGAGLDVLEEEGPTKDELSFLVSGSPGEHNIQTILQNHALIDMQNVVVTPHNAFNTKEALARILNTTLGNIQSYLGGEPVNVVNG